MKIAYINKTAWLSNMPSTIFSTFNAAGFAECGADTVLFFKPAPSNRADMSFIEFFGEKKPEKLRIHIENDKFLFLKSNEIFYSKVEKQILREGTFDAVITRDPGFLPNLIRIKNKSGAKVLYQSHNFYIDTSFQVDQIKINQSKFQKNEMRYIPLLSGMLALNNPQKELYEKYTDINIFAGKPGLWKRAQHNDNFQKKNILYSGSFQMKKGIDVLMRAFANLKDKSSNLILAGGRNSNETDPVNKLALELGIEKRTKVTGWLSFAELNNLLAEASVGIIPLADTFYNQYLTAPSKLFDYLAYGIPVIASDLPSVRDFVINNEDAVLVSPGSEQELTNAIDSILYDKELYKSMSDCAYNRANEYIWKNRAKAMMDFIETLS